MPWSSVQKTRLGFEKQLLERHFPGKVTWIDPTGNTKVQVKVTCSNDKEYTLRIYIPPDYPNSCPEMIVYDPSLCLRNFEGDPLPPLSTEYHTLEHKDGCTKICHYKPWSWCDKNTLYQVTAKGFLWLEAYETHLRNGSFLSRYLCHAP